MRTHGTGADGHSPVRPHRARMAALVAVLAVGAPLTGGCSAGTSGHVSAPTATVTVTVAPSAPPPASRPVKKRAVSPPRSVAAPVRIEIPRLDIDRRLIGLQVDPGTGTLRAPGEWSQVGWWSDGPAPGAAGSAIVAGHVDSPAGPAVFAGLRSLRAGDRVVIDRADGTQATFAVTELQVYDVDNFPDDRVYRLHGPPSLHLLTCTGTYDRRAGRYLQNAVVYTRLVIDTADRS